MDTDRRMAFSEHMLTTLTGGALTMLVSIGYRLGLFEAAALGAGTSLDLAERAGLQERYVREWPGAMVTGGFFHYDQASGEYLLPPEHAALLTGDTAANVAPMASMLRAFSGALPELEQCFVHGGGVNHESFAPHFEAAGAEFGDTWRRIYDEHLVGGFFGAVPGLNARLAAGTRMLDLGCGTGHAVNVAARAFPASRFLGVDIDPRVIRVARAERDRLGLVNAAFAVADAAVFTPRSRFEVITAFDAVHDQHSPLEVLRRAREALLPGGVFVMVDTNFSSQLEDNVGNPLAPLCYAISLMYCITVSLAQHGAGLGAMWGTERARALLAEAGFIQVEIIASLRPQNCIFACHA